MKISWATLPASAQAASATFEEGLIRSRREHQSDCNIADRLMHNILSLMERTHTMPSCQLEIMPIERPRWARWMGSQNLVFPVLWLLIGVISAVDTYLTVKFRDTLHLLESNPIANMLLDLDGGDASLLIGFKFLGSIIALGILAALYFQ